MPLTNVVPPARRRRHKDSAEYRRKLSAAQKRRWAAVRAVIELAVQEGKVPDDVKPSELRLVRRALGLEN
jgi:hypothetical protein